MTKKSKITKIKIPKGSKLPPQTAVEVAGFGDRDELDKDLKAIESFLKKYDNGEPIYLDQYVGKKEAKELNKYFGRKVTDYHFEIYSMSSHLGCAIFVYNEDLDYYSDIDFNFYDQGDPLTKFFLSVVKKWMTSINKENFLNALSCERRVEDA